MWRKDGLKLNPKAVKRAVAVFATVLEIQHV
jgi:hypothetical protein